MIDRTEAERVFLGAVLHENALLASSNLAPEMFTAKYSRIFAKILDLSNRGRVSLDDLIPFQKDLEATTLVTIEEAFWPQWQLMHDSIFEAWATEKAHSAYRIALTQGYRDSIETVEQVMTSLMQREGGRRTKVIGDLLHGAMERIIARSKSNGAIPGLSFGMESLDFATLGAQNGQLIIIGARPSEGKSALAAQLIRHMSREVKAGLLTIESDEMEVTFRLLAGEGQIDSRKLQTGRLTEFDMVSLKNGLSQLDGRRDNIMIHDKPGIRLTQLQTTARQMVRQGVKIIFVDYLQLVRIPAKKDKREEVGEVSTSLKALARELDIPIVALAQLGRDSDNRRPHLGDFQHSSQIEQDADQCWLIWHKRDDKGQIEESRIIVAKARDGTRRDVRVRFNAPTLSFFEIEDER